MTHMPVYNNTDNSMKTKLINRLTASRAVFYAIVGMAAVMFALFRLMGFDTPYDDNPDYNAPLLTGALIVFMELLAAAALALAVWSIVRSARLNRRAGGTANNIPVRRISVCTAAGTLLLLAATFALSDADSIAVNGTAYASWFWLHAAGMFIGTSAAMIAIAAGAVIYGTIRNRRQTPCS